ncbi:hypothetical protein L596_030361 [Steinernema carpocapsae]|uniref:FLYWCH-type domain-containing protein n=1 Tax=Steinernema carpocapsae TaxID=34508 RepID=A0A4U5LP59_STECR|nr:hypothetical protein L596_030361 [Steinernema carpocapsae]
MDETSSSDAVATKHYFSTTLRGGLKLWLDKYSYVKQKKINGSGHIRFSCCQRQNLHCKGFLVLKEDLNDILRSGPHNHEPTDSEKCDQFKIDSWMALNDEQTTALIEKVKERPQLWMDKVGSMELSAARTCCHTFNYLRQTLPAKYMHLLSFLPTFNDEDRNLDSVVDTPMIDEPNDQANDSCFEEISSKRIKLEPEECSVFESPPEPKPYEEPVDPSESQSHLTYSLKIVQILEDLESRGMTSELHFMKTQIDILMKQMKTKIRNHDVPEQDSWMP